MQSKLLLLRLSILLAGLGDLLGGLLGAGALLASAHVEPPSIKVQYSTAKNRNLGKMLGDLPLNFLTVNSAACKRLRPRCHCHCIVCPGLRSWWSIAFAGGCLPHQE